MCSTSGSFKGKFTNPVTITSSSITGNDLTKAGRTIRFNFVTSGGSCFGTVSSTQITCVFPMTQRDQVLDYLEAGKKIEVYGVGTSQINPAHWEV